MNLCFNHFLNTFSANQVTKAMPLLQRVFNASLKPVCIPVLSMLSCSTILWSQEVQLTQRSIGSENHYAISSPSQLEGDLIVAGAYEFPSLTTNARLKRLKANGEIVWDVYMEADGMPNRAMHVDPSGWGEAAATVFGFMEEGPKEALIYGVADDATIMYPMKLSTPGGNFFEETTFLHGIQSADGGWVAVGEYKSGPNRSGLVVKLNPTGTLAWSIHIDAPSTNAGPDYDALNHVIEVPDYGYIVGGSGNYIDPSGMVKQGALAALVSYNGSQLWGQTYVHSDLSYESVAARTVATSNGKYYQIVNGRGDPTYIENGFSIYEVDILNGIAPFNVRHIHIQEHPIKVMSAYPHPENPEHLLLAGFLELDVTNLPYGPNDPQSFYDIAAGDRPPFLMEINPGIIQPGLSCIEWHEVYDVPASFFGVSPSWNRYDVFSNMGDQPEIFHPEMLLVGPETNPKLIGYKDDYAASNEFDMEFIGTNLEGVTECPTLQANLIELERAPVISPELSFTPKEYALFPFAPNVLEPVVDILPCDICFPEVQVVTDEVTCDFIRVLINPIGENADDVCYDIIWSDGTSASGTDTTIIEKPWTPGTTNLTFSLNSYCCNEPAMTGIPVNTSFELPEGCDCGTCAPFVRAEQNHQESVTYFSDGSFSPTPTIPLTLFDQEPGCTPGSVAEYELSFWSFFSPYMPFSNCLDDRTVEWQIDGATVASFGCGLPSDYSGLKPFGEYEVTAILTDCSETICADTLHRTLTLEACTPPEYLPFSLVDATMFCSGPFACGKYLNAGLAVPPCMTLDWIIDGEVFEDDPMVSELHCFGWGSHSVSLRATCNDDPSRFTESEPQEFYCGPTLTPTLIYDLELCTIEIEVSDILSEMSLAFEDTFDIGDFDANDAVFSAYVTSCDILGQANQQPQVAIYPLDLMSNANNGSTFYISIANASNIQALSLSISYGDWFVGIIDFPDFIPPICEVEEIPGCTDPNALNFDPMATIDDGSCIYPDQNPEPCDSVCDLMVTYEMLAGAYWSAPPMVQGDVLFTDAGVEVSVDILGPLADNDGDGDVDFDDSPSVEYVEVVPSPMPMIFGNGHVLRTANAVVKFDIDAVMPNVDEVCFEILDLGGVDNIAINGSTIIITSADLNGDGIMDTPFYGGQEVLNGTFLGGVFVSASKMTFPGGAKILFRLIGDVNELAIGGQEYWIDDLCIDGTPVVDPIQGCTDSTACNYDQSATQDDGSCNYPETGYDCSGQGIINGCMDSSACNFNPTATIQTANDICIYPVDGYNCSGQCTNDTDGDGICDENEAAGCTDPSGINYNPEADFDDGSCIYAGCTDSSAFNYDPDANFDDGSCEYPGCTDPNALNFDPMATIDDGSCIYPDQNPEPCDSVCDLMVTYEMLAGAYWSAPPMVQGDVLFTDAGVEVSVDILGPLADNDGDGDVDFDDSPSVEYVEVVPSPMPMIFGNGHVLRTANAVVKFDIDAVMPNVDEVCFEILDLGGVDNIAINGSTIIITSADLNGDGIMDTPFYGGQEVLNGTFLGGVFVSASKMTFPGGAKILFRLIGDVNELAIGGQEYWIDDLCIDGTPVVDPIQGCTDSTACNYDQSATQDDGSCNYPETGYDCSGGCLFDSDNDGVCDQWEQVGCQDENACNFVQGATEEGYCDYPEQGYNCDGTCVSDGDGDGVCDQDELPGCTDDDAVNYYPLATDDDGTCIYDNSCSTDINGDNQVTVSDLLLLLGSFGNICE